MAHGATREESPATPPAESRALWAAVAAAWSGLIAGALAYAATGTLQVMLSPDLTVRSPLGWLMGPILVFAGGLAWGLIGGGLFLLPPSFLAFLWIARRARVKAPPSLASASLALWAALFAPLLVFGARGRAVDAVLLGIALGIGVYRGFARLGRGIAPG